MPPKRTTPKGYQGARKLHQEPTPAEMKLWAHLRGNKLNGVNFRRQHALGNFIVDFVSIKRKLVIELDGSQHLEHEEYDVARTKYFESQGYTVIRLWNNQVMNDIEGVIRAIIFAMESQSRSEKEKSHV
jgi:very-short-patch-repair endonuclease